jgi:hypothetical protein
MTMSHKFFIPAVFFLISAAACTSNEIGNSRDVNPDAVFFDYRINGQEGDENVNCVLQYRFGGPNGTTLVMDDSSQVMLDGETLKVDSAKLSGAFYEVEKPVSSFAGNHVIQFTDRSGKTYKEAFAFLPFTFVNPLPENWKREDQVILLKGLEKTDYIRVVATDTSFSSDDINRLDTVTDGKITITKEELKNLVNGPVNLQLIREIEHPVKQGTKEGGRIAINYEVKRQVELKD